MWSVLLSCTTCMCVLASNSYCPVQPHAGGGGGAGLVHRRSLVLIFFLSLSLSLCFPAIELNLLLPRHAVGLGAPQTIIAPLDRRPLGLSPLEREREREREEFAETSSEATCEVIDASLVDPTDSGGLVDPTDSS